MKIALLSSHRENDGVARYVTNLTIGLRRKKNLEIASYESKITSSFIKKVVTFDLDNFGRNFRKYDVIHNTYFNFIFNSAIRCPISRNRLVLK